jgi:(2Fe-2S) ferredoxin
VSYYKHHVFFCVNRRESGENCCAQKGADALQAYAKARIKSLRRAGPGGIRVNRAGCLDRCDLGPCVVVYPEGVWYTYVDEKDVDEIIESHLLHGQIVERLLLP